MRKSRERVQSRKSPERERQGFHSAQTPRRVLRVSAFHPVFVSQPSGFSAPLSAAAFSSRPK